MVSLKRQQRKKNSISAIKSNAKNLTAKKKCGNFNKITWYNFMTIIRKARKEKKKQSHQKK